MDQPRDEHRVTDCSEALVRAYEFLDGEMGPEDCARIQQHLDECGECLRAYDLDTALKSLVKRSCACEEAPAQLRSSILESIVRMTSVSVEQTGDGLVVEQTTITQYTRGGEPRAI